MVIIIMKDRYIKCSYWRKHYETYLDVETDVNLELAKLQENNHKIINVDISATNFNLENLLYTYSITILYK